MLRRPRVFSLVLALSIASLPLRASAQTPPPDRRTHGAINCRVETPVQWNAGNIAWIGACKDGYAEGLGALRNIVQGTSAELFLGRVDRGYLRSGVLDTAQGYTAGRWDAGSVTPPGSDGQPDRNIVITAFEDGAKAADAIAKSMAKQSNPKAARFYTRLAKRLRSQMD